MGLKGVSFRLPVGGPKDPSIPDGNASVPMVRRRSPLVLASLPSFPPHPLALLLSLAPSPSALLRPGQAEPMAEIPGPLPRVFLGLLPEEVTGKGLMWHN